MVKGKSGRELEPERGYKGPPIARRFFGRFFGFFGIEPGVDDVEEE